MNPNHQEVRTPVRPAATVVLLRDAADGLEVLLLRRHGELRRAGRRLRLPWRQARPRGQRTELLAHLDVDPPRLHAALGEPDLDVESAAGLFVAACRETFEEAGILLAPASRRR